MRIFTKSLLAWCLGAAISGTAIAGPSEDASAAYERRDYAAALKGYRALAARGDAKAQVWLGRMYEYGYGVAENDAEALRWYRAAADKGNGQAMDLLSYRYEFGEGVEKSEAEADRWGRAAVVAFRSAAARGDAEAMNELAKHYHDGTSVKQDDAKALRWFRAAAVKGNVSAMVTLADAYGFGVGVRVAKNAAQSARWNRAAAEKGNVRAMYFLAVDYDTGNGVATNKPQATHWFRAAAAKGNASAARALNDPGFRAGLGKPSTPGPRCTHLVDRPNNRPPTVALNVVSVAKLSAAGATVALRTVAIDPDGDGLRYTYSATAGHITGDGADVIWAVTKPGTYTVTVGVSDGACLSFASLTRKIGNLPARAKK